MATELTHDFCGETKRKTGVDKWVEFYCSTGRGTEPNSYVVSLETVQSYSGAEDSEEEIGQFMKC